MLKRLLDILVSFVGLLLLSPFLLVIAVGIKADSEGSVFYKGERVGRYGKSFKIYKFRTMVQNAEQLGGSSTANDDKRLTKLSGFLKKYQIDEIPQLINVLRGEMSLVGFRPDTKFYTDMLTDKERIILSIKPGITDYASLWNFHEGEVLKGSTDPEKLYQEKIRPKKIELQLKYIKEQSFLTDLEILFRTIKKVISQ